MKESIAAKTKRMILVHNTEQFYNDLKRTRNINVWAAQSECWFIATKISVEIAAEKKIIRYTMNETDPFKTMSIW